MYAGTNQNPERILKHDGQLGAYSITVTMTLLDSEVTPLLNPVYLASDAETREALKKAQTSQTMMFGEELKTLLQYTGPIFGYVVDTLPSAQICSFPFALAHIFPSMRWLLSQSFASDTIRQQGWQRLRLLQCLR
jgi:hypothetical protein